MTKNKRRLISIGIPIFSALIGILIGCIILLATGGVEAVTTFFNAMYKATVQGILQGDLQSFGDWLYFSIPLILCGLSVAFAYRVGLFNIGAEGQFIVASFVAVFLGVKLDFPGSFIIVIILASVSAMLYAFIPGLLKAKLGISEVVVTIMMNWIALLYVNAYLIPDVFNDGSSVKTPNINANSSLVSDFFTNLTDGSNFTIGFFITIAIVIIYAFIMNRTKFGYEIKAVGYSPFSAQYAGIKKNSRIILSMMIAGLFAGLAGSIFSLGETGSLTATADFRNYGFDGIAVAFLGQLSGFGIFLSGLLFSGLRSSESYIQNTPNEIVDIIIAVIVITSAFGNVAKKKLFRKLGD